MKKIKKKITINKRGQMNVLIVKCAAKKKKTSQTLSHHQKSNWALSMFIRCQKYCNIYQV